VSVDQESKIAQVGRGGIWEGKVQSDGNCDFGKFPAFKFVVRSRHGLLCYAASGCKLCRGSARTKTLSIFMMPECSLFCTQVDNYFPTFRH
jgi:hypothetical protein